MFGKPQYAEINALLNKKYAEKKHLIAVHRGSYTGNITQNTVPAYIAAIRMGADMVEGDINSTTDDILYVFHDGHEPDVFGVEKNVKTMSSEELEGLRPYNAVFGRVGRRINRFEEVIDFLPEHVLYNVDRAWDIFPKVVKVLDKYPKALQQVVIKAPMRAKEAVEFLANYPVKYMFMPICYSLADVDEALSYEGLNVVGCELIAATPEDELFSDEAIAYVHSKNLYTWVNSIELGELKADYSPRPTLYGGVNDDVSVIEGPDKGWGVLMDKKIDVIQTDWPALLYAYREGRCGVK